MMFSEIVTQIQWEMRDSVLSASTLAPVLNAIQSQWIQPKAKVQLTPVPTISVVSGTASYTLAGISTSIWSVRFLTETISGKQYNLDPLLAEDDVESDGIRLFGDTFYFQPTPAAARTINVYANKKLTAFSAASTSVVPDIPVEFHDLYVLGGCARVGRRVDELDTPEPRDYWAEFLNRLEALAAYQDRRRYEPKRRKVRARGYF